MKVCSAPAGHKEERVSTGGGETREGAVKDTRQNQGWGEQRQRAVKLTRDRRKPGIAMWGVRAYPQDRLEQELQSGLQSCLVYYGNRVS